MTDELAGETPKMTSSASQPDLLGGWDNWATGGTTTTSKMTNTDSKPTTSGNLLTNQRSLICYITLKMKSIKSFFLTSSFKSNHSFTHQTPDHHLISSHCI